MNELTTRIDFVLKNTIRVCFTQKIMFHQSIFFYLKTDLETKRKLIRIQARNHDKY